MACEVSPPQKKLYTNPRVLVLAIDAMLVMLGFGIIAPSMAFYLIALEGGLDQPPGPDYIVPETVVAEFSLILGVMMAAFMFSRTLFARYWGGVSDTKGRKPLLITGLFGYVVLLFFFGLAQNWIHLLIIRFTQGLVSGMVWPVAEAALMDIVGTERRGEGLGLYMMVSNVGFIAGPGIGGVLYNFCRDVLLLSVPDVFRVPYYIAALIVVPAVISTAMVLKETAPGKVRTAEIEPETEVDESDSSRVEIPDPVDVDEADIKPARQRMINALYLMALMNGIAMGLGQPIFQLFLMSKITTDIGLIGLIISGAGAVGMLFSIPAGRYSDKEGRKGVAVGGALLARGTFIVLPLTRDIYQTSVVWVAQGASMSASQPALRAIQADVVPWKLRGKMFGTIQAFFNAGATIGPLAGGALFGFFSLLVFQIGPFAIEGLVIPFWLAGILGIIGAIVLWAFVEETVSTEVIHVEGSDESIEDAT